MRGGEAETRPPPLPACQWACRQAVGLPAGRPPSLSLHISVSGSARLGAARTRLPARPLACTHSMWANLPPDVVGLLADGLAPRDVASLRLTSR